MIKKNKTNFVVEILKNGLLLLFYILVISLTILLISEVTYAQEESKTSGVELIESTRGFVRSVWDLTKAAYRVVKATVIVVGPYVGVTIVLYSIVRLEYKIDMLEKIILKDKGVESILELIKENDE